MTDRASTGQMHIQNVANFFAKQILISARMWQNGYSNAGILHGRIEHLGAAQMMAIRCRLRASRS